MIDKYNRPTVRPSAKPSADHYDYLKNKIVWGGVTTVSNDRLESLGDHFNELLFTIVGGGVVGKIPNRKEGRGHYVELVI